MYAGSIPTPASSSFPQIPQGVNAWVGTTGGAAVVKLVDTADLKSAASESKHAGSIPARGTNERWR